MDDPPAPIRYEGTIHLLPIVDDNRTFIEWPVTLHTTPGRRGGVAGAVSIVDPGMDGIATAGVGAAVIARSVFAASLRATAKQSIALSRSWIARRCAPRNDG